MLKMWTLFGRLWSSVMYLKSRVHPMPGNIWVVVFTTEETAEEATNGFILKESRIRPTLIGKRFITATVAYAPVNATLGDIERALEPYAEVISINDLFIRDFPEIKNGKQRVVLKPRHSKLPSFFQVGTYKASLFFTGRVSCCPYCEETDHLEGTAHVKEKKCFKCGRLGHYQRSCPDNYQRYEDYARQTRQEQNNNNDRDRHEERMDATRLSDEQAAERDSTPSVSVDMDGVEELSDDESSDSSVDTLIEVPDNNATATATTITTPPTATKDTINIVTVNKETEEVLVGLFSPERPTKAESEQQRQETEDENTQVLFTDTESTPKDTQNTETTPKDTQEEMDIQQNLKRKPLAKVDLRLKFGQSPKPRRSPKHKRRKEKI